MDAPQDAHRDRGSAPRPAVGDEVDYSRKWYVMAAVTMSILLATIDGSIVNVALPTLVRALDTSFATVQWVVLGYLLAQATLLLSMGRLGDMIGKKRIFSWGFVVFTVGSVLCGLSPSVYWLIGFRVVQAVGAAMMFALGIAIVTEAFPDHERGRALGIAGTAVSIGIVIGPTLGGAIIDALSWRWIFLVNLPVGIIGTWMAVRFVPDTRPEGEQRFDVAGATAMFVSLLGLLLALTWGQEIGFDDTRVLGLLVVWLVFLVAFLVIERRVPQPMIELALFRNPLFSINLITGLMTFIAIGGTIILMPFYLENVLGYAPRQVGFLLAVVPITLGVTAPLSGALSDRLGTRPITVVGLLVLLGGYLGMATLDTTTTALGFVLRFMPLGLGIGVFQSPNNSAVMGSVPSERLGVASGLLSISRTVGQITGVAVLGALWAARVFGVHGARPPGGATEASAVAQVAGLHDTFLVLAALMAIALALAVAGLVRERRLGRRPRRLDEARDERAPAASESPS